MRGDEAASDFTIQTAEDDGSAYACIAEIHKKTQNYIFFRVRFRKKNFRFIYIIKGSGLSSAEGNARGICRKRGRKQKKLFF